jgi:hypothetical protein
MQMLKGKKKGNGWLVETVPLKQIHEALSSFYVVDVRNLVTAGSPSRPHFYVTKERHMRTADKA